MQLVLLLKHALPKREQGAYSQGHAGETTAFSQTLMAVA